MGLTEKSSHKIVEPKVEKIEKQGCESETSESPGSLIEAINKIEIKIRNLNYKDNLVRSNLVLLMGKKKKMQSHGC